MNYDLQKSFHFSQSTIFAAKEYRLYHETYYNVVNWWIINVYNTPALWHVGDDSRYMPVFNFSVAAKTLQISLPQSLLTSSCLLCGIFIPLVKD